MHLQLLGRSLGCDSLPLERGVDFLGLSGELKSTRAVSNPASTRQVVNTFDLHRLQVGGSTSGFGKDNCFDLARGISKSLNLSSDTHVRDFL